jgi:thiamine biosynthesis protein ThiS
MRLSINGELREAAKHTTVSELLESLLLDPDAHVVWRNAAIVERERYDDMLLAENDQLDVVRLAGGG